MSPAHGGPLLFREVNVGDLTSCVHAGVCTPSYRKPSRTAQHHGQRLFQYALDGKAPGLHGPPAEGTAVVRDIQADTLET